MKNESCPFTWVPPTPPCQPGALVASAQCYVCLFPQLHMQRGSTLSSPQPVRVSLPGLCRPLLLLSGCGCTSRVSSALSMVAFGLWLLSVTATLGVTVCFFLHRSGVTRSRGLCVYSFHRYRQVACQRGFPRLTDAPTERDRKRPLSALISAGS